MAHNEQPAIEVRVRDNGPGLAPEARQSVFEPFFTTKTKGTGLGMAIARQIVEAHGGQIGVGRRRPRGRVHHHLAENRAMKRGMRIAVADDEPDVRDYFRRMLPRLGHDVVGGAANGRELVELCREHKPDLIIADVRMPEMDGDVAMRCHLERAANAIYTDFGLQQTGRSVTGPDRLGCVSLDEAGETRRLKMRSSKFSRILTASEA